MQKRLQSVLILMSLATSTFHSASEAASGVIMFRGEIINESCPADSVGRKVALVCPEEKTKSNALRLSDDMQGRDLPAPISEIKTRWLDAGHRTGIMTIVYK